MQDFGKSFKSPRDYFQCLPVFHVTLVFSVITLNPMHWFPFFLSAILLRRKLT